MREIEQTVTVKSTLESEMFIQSMIKLQADKTSHGEVWNGYEYPGVSMGLPESGKMVDIKNIKFLKSVEFGDLDVTDPNKIEIKITYIKYQEDKPWIAS